MSSIHSHVRPGDHLFLRLPSELLRLVEIRSNAIIDIGRLGCFSSNLLLGRPYYHTYELLEKEDGRARSQIRKVSQSELNAEIVAEAPTPSESRDEGSTPTTGRVPEGYDLLNEDGTVVMKNNRLTIDDATRQALSQQEIEELKQSSGGKEIIEKILANHSGLEEKTDFAKAKYMLRKTKKYLKRFTVLPMNLGNLMEYITAKEPSRILELREESLGLVMAWSNIHADGQAASQTGAVNDHPGRGRWLVTDETGGLVVAAMAERMGILYPPIDDEDPLSSPLTNGQHGTNGDLTNQLEPDASEPTEASAIKSPKHTDFPTPASSNTITLLHPAVQANMSLLKYFGYDTNQPNPSHPLHTHLKPLSWLQLIHPEEDPTYCEPEQVSPAELQTWKSGKRGAHWKKRRRWERCRAIVDDARQGGFDAFVMASSMDAESALRHVVPLIRGGGHIVIYSPTAEPLVRLVDLYSRDRKTAYIQHLANGETPNPEDFPLDPRLLLAPTLQTSRAREWQVLPGRTHPLMGSRGGAEGYVFTARRVLPLDGGVVAKGNFSAKRRKVEKSS